ncbi:MAG: hypothetical protein BYD32DRAFT_277587 [Podila humilis]|nr:MAG: hypothetical protein BYD32DRAFT_277587 [Podila humilis]
MSILLPFFAACATKGSCCCIFASCITSGEHVFGECGILRPAQETFNFLLLGLCVSNCSYDRKERQRYGSYMTSGRHADGV